MDKRRLDDRYVQGLPVPKTGTQRIWDQPDTNPKKTWCSGFGVRLSAGGGKVFILRYRNKHRQEKLVSIGQYPVWSTDAARDQAIEMRRRIKDGGDPLKELQDERNAPTINDLCDRFLSDYLPRRRPSTIRSYSATIATDIRPRLGRKLVAVIDHDDVQNLHAEVSRRAPYVGNRMVALLSIMFEQAIRWKMRQDNPARKIERNPEQKRKRYLSEAELGRLTAALDAHPDQQVANAIRIMLATGCRKGEALGAT
jgi:integrase